MAVATAAGLENELDAFYRTVVIAPLLTAEQERLLASAIRSQLPDAAAARDLMVRSNIRLVVKIAKAFVGRGITLSDLICEGTFGLLEAVDRFDPDRGCRFATYAAFWIKKEIRLALQRQGLIRTKGANGAFPVAGGAILGVEGFACTVGDARGETIGAASDPSLALERAEYEELARRRLLEAVARLPRMQQLVITLRFGLDKAERLPDGRSLRKVGRLLNCSRSTVSYHEKGGIETLRAILDPRL